jgi:hypothetical protein
MRIKTSITTVLLSVVFCTGLYAQSNDPENTNSYTLEDLYDRLNAGTTGSQSTFTEPTTAPGTATMYTLDAIMGKAPVADNTNGATTEQVANGKTFWGLRTDGTWGAMAGEAYGTYTVSGGTLVGTRWYDNGDGTVTDLTTGLV